jgi:hypothetical protein
MPTISKLQFQDYEQLCNDRNSGRLLTPDGLRFICEACHYDAAAIGQHFLELLPRVCPEASAMPSNP